MLITDKQHCVTILLTQAGMERDRILWHHSQDSYSEDELNMFKTQDLQILPLLNLTMKFRGLYFKRNTVYM
jgi:hypothetical protein